MKHNGCPRHLNKPDKRCEDMRCLLTWEPPNAPSGEEQLAQWALGNSICPNKQHECCPDFSCCKPHLAWSLDKRAKYMAVGQGEREKMMMGALSALTEDANVYVTRGNPTDRE